MTSATGRVDEFVKDYLTFRGLSTTLRTLEIELKNEKEKGFRVDKMVEQLHGYILSYDLANLREYWNFLVSRLFSRLEQRYASSVRKLEVGLLKFYLVNASQCKQQDKIIEFFERMTELLQTQSEFREWFAFPFVRFPEDNSHYAMYFTRQWQDSFLLSLQNFLSVILQCMPEPALLNFEADYRRLRELQEENDKLKQQLLCLGEKPEVISKSTDRDQDMRLEEHNHMELLYDFSSLGEDTAVPEPASKSPRKFPFTSSPLSIVKKDKQHTSPGKKKDDSIKMTSVSAPKESKSKSTASKLLPVITRQKKSKSVSSQNQWALQDTSQSSEAESTTNQKSVETSLANQRIKKFEEAKQARKELLEGFVEQPKPKEDKPKTKESSDVAFNRSVSEPVEMPKTPHTETRKSSSKNLPENKMETVSPLVSSSMAAMLSTGMASGGEEMTTSPAQKHRSETMPTLTETEPKTLDTVPEKPYILLSQDEYTEHRSALSYARFSNSGHYIASVDVDGVVKVWTWSPQAVTAATVMSKSAFLSLEWASKSDRWLLLGNRSGNIRLFDVREMKSFYEATGDTSYPRIINLCSNPAGPTFVCSSTTGRTRSNSFGTDTGPGSGSKIGKLTLWDLKTMKSDRQLPLEPGPVCINSCAFNHNGQVLITGGVDGVIRMFDVSQQRCITHWAAHTREIRTVLFSADFTSCYSLGNDGKLIEWSVHKTGHKLRELPIHSGAVPLFQTEESSVSKEAPVGNLLALDGDSLLSVGDNGAIIYKVMKGGPGMSQVMTLKTPRSSPITTVDWSPNIDTKVCLTGCRDGIVTVSTLLSQ